MSEPTNHPTIRYVSNLEWTRLDKAVDLDEHGWTMHYWKSVENGKTLCDLCDITASRLSDLKRHYKGKHGEIRLVAKRGIGPHRSIRSSRSTVGVPQRRNLSASGSSSGEPTPAIPSPIAMPAAPALQAMEKAPQESIDEWVVNIPPFLNTSGLAIMENFNAILCIECEVCIPADHALGHLKDKHRFTDLSQEEFRKFARNHGLVRSHGDIIDQVKKSRQFRQCPWLRQMSGWWCEECGYATTSEARAEEHGRMVGHFSEKEVVISGQTRRRRQKVVGGTVQSLFYTHLSGTIPSIPSAAEASPSSAFNVFEELLELEKDVFNPPLISQDDPRTVHPFIRISSWHRWIGSMESKEVQALQVRMKVHTMSLGKRLLLHCEEMMRFSFKLCVAETYMARCLVNSPKTTIETKPFGEITSEGGQETYTTTWANFIAYLINCQELGDVERRFKLSSDQQEQLSIYKGLLDNPLSEEEPDPKKNPNSLCDTAVEALTLLSASLICHEFEGDGSSSHHPIIAFTVLSSIHPGNVIANPVHISPFLAKLEYFCRTTIMVLSNMETIGPQAVNFFQGVKMHLRWIKEGENTPFAWIRQMLHLTAFFVHGTNQMPRFVWGVDGGKSYTFDGFRIEVSQFIALVKCSVQEAVDGFFDLWDAYGLPQHMLFTELDGVGDALAVRSTNYNFARHPSNKKLQDRAKACETHAINSKRFCKLVEGKLVWHPNMIRAALEKSEAFLRCLAAALYLGSGQPPRGSELMSTLITNIDTRVRNVFFSNKSAVLSHFLNKTTFLLKSDKAIVREVCTALSLVLLNYIAFLRPIEAKLAARVDVSMADVEWMLRQLFRIGSKHLSTEELTQQLKLLWRKIVTIYGDRFPGWGTADTRQNAVYVGKHEVKSPTLSHDTEPLLDLQAGHSSTVARNWYGVEGNRLGGDIDPDVMAQFCCLSRAHHSAYGLTSLPFQHSSNVQGPSPVPLPLPDSSLPNSTPLPPPSSNTQLPDTAASTPSATLLPFDPELLTQQVADSVAKALGTITITNTPASSAPWDSMLGAADRVFNAAVPAVAASSELDPVVFSAIREVVPEGRFRSVEQAAATQVAWKRKEHLLVILPTGGGKTMVAEVTTRLERQAELLNVIMVPLKALADDLKARFTEGRVMVEIWHGQRPSFCQVLIATYESAAKEDFLSFLREHADKGTLGRIIIDECHYPVFSTRDGFRDAMRSLASLVCLRGQLVLLTATAPVLSTTQILEFYGVPRATVIRASTNRPNIRYIFQKVEDKPHEGSEHQFIYDHLQEAIRSLKPERECKVIIFMRSKALINAIWELAKATGESWVRYHADMTLEDKAAALAAWMSVMLATSAFGLGVNPQDCGMVLHWEAPRSMLDYVQESGRAGRDGNIATSVILWSWMPPAEPQDHGKEFVRTMLQTERCRRRTIFMYMDGSAADCLSLPSDNRLCDNCIRAINVVEASEEQTAPPPNPVGPAILESPIPDSVDGQLTIVASIAKSLDKGCSKCYLLGRDRFTHRKGEWWCNSAGDYVASEVAAYKAWKALWNHPQKGSFTNYVCKLCWLPDRTHHKPNSNTWPPCLYADSLGPLAWAVFHNEAIWDEFKAAHPGAAVSTLNEWAKWLSSPGAMPSPGFWELAVWVDRLMASMPGRRSLYDYQGKQ